MCSFTLSNSSFCRFCLGICNSLLCISSLFSCFLLLMLSFFLKLFEKLLFSLCLISLILHMLSHKSQIILELQSFSFKILNSNSGLNMLSSCNVQVLGCLFSCLFSFFEIFLVLMDFNGKGFHFTGLSLDFFNFVDRSDLDALHLFLSISKCFENFWVALSFDDFLSLCLLDSSLFGFSFGDSLSLNLLGLSLVFSFLLSLFFFLLSLFLLLLLLFLLLLLLGSFFCLSLNLSFSNSLLLFFLLSFLFLFSLNFLMSQLVSLFLSFFLLLSLSLKLLLEFLILFQDLLSFSLGFL